MADSAKTIERVGSQIHADLNRSIGSLLDAVPGDDVQRRVDTLRAIHQVLAAHIGTIEHLIIDGFGDQAPENIVSLLVEERERLVREGNKHGAYHTTGSYDPH
jgi:hypothetical protein